MHHVLTANAPSWALGSHPLTPESCGVSDLESWEEQSQPSLCPRELKRSASSTGLFSMQLLLVSFLHGVHAGAN